MARRSTSPVVAIAVGVAAVRIAGTAQAQAQLTDTFYFAHDDTFETQSSLFNGIVSAPADEQPDDQRLYFPDDVLDTADNDTAEGGNNNFTVPDVDDAARGVRVRRGARRGERVLHGAAQLGATRRSTSTCTSTGSARTARSTRRPWRSRRRATTRRSRRTSRRRSTRPVEPGTYVIYVDNWCSSESDPIVDETAECAGIADRRSALRRARTPGIDEDDFSGKVEFSPLVKMNRLPVGEPRGPRRAATRASASPSRRRSGLRRQHRRATTSTSTATVCFEYTPAPRNPSVTKLFDQPGRLQHRLRVIDDRGGVGYDSQLLRVKGAAPATPSTPVETKAVAADPVLYSFKLSSPVFGGRKGVALVARYRLRKGSRVDLGALPRHGQEDPPRQDARPGHATRRQAVPREDPVARPQPRHVHDPPARDAVRRQRPEDLQARRPQALGMVTGRAARCARAPCR